MGTSPRQYPELNLTHQPALKVVLTTERLEIHGAGRFPALRHREWFGPLKGVLFAGQLELLSSSTVGGTDFWMARFTWDGDRCLAQASLPMVTTCMRERKSDEQRERGGGEGKGRGRGKRTTEERNRGSVVIVPRKNARAPIRRIGKTFLFL